jgi:hypothetical protein
MARKMKQKDPFDDLDLAFKESIESMSPAEINSRIAEWAKNQEQTKAAMKDDEDLAQKREIVKLAAEPYRDAIKANSLRIAYSMRVLCDRGAE